MYIKHIISKTMVGLLLVAMPAAAGVVEKKQSAETSGEPKPLTLVANLTDGSRLKGLPEIDFIPVQTTYARLKVPLKQIISVKIDDDHENAAFELRNGDKLKGVIDLAPIKMETLMGKVSIQVEYITRIDVLPSEHGVFTQKDMGSVVADIYACAPEGLALDKALATAKRSISVNYVRNVG